MSDMADRNTRDRIDSALDEEALRRALRFEPDEHPPRFDAAALALAAERRSLSGQLLRVVRGAAVLGLGLGIPILVALVGLNTLAERDLSGPASVGLSLVAAVAQRIVAVGEITTGPSVAVAALAAVLFAMAYERTTGMEPRRVRTA